jgi:hypothetical protein
VKHGGGNSTSASSTEQTGGTSMPSEYFGFSTGAFSALNAGGINMSDAHFGAGGYIRPALDIMMGGSQILNVTRHNATAKKFVKAVLKFNNLTISKNAMNELMLVIDIHITCLINDINKNIQTSNSHITLSKVEKVLDLKRHSVFK